MRSSGKDRDEVEKELKGLLAWGKSATIVS